MDAGSTGLSFQTRGHGVPDLVKNNSPSGEIVIGYAYKGAQAGSSQKAKIR